VVVEGLLSVRPGVVVHAVPYEDKTAAARPGKAN